MILSNRSIEPRAANSFQPEVRLQQPRQHSAQLQQLEWCWSEPQGLCAHRVIHTRYPRRAQSPRGARYPRRAQSLRGARYPRRAQSLRETRYPRRAQSLRGSRHPRRAKPEGVQISTEGAKPEGVQISTEGARPVQKELKIKQCCLNIVQVSD